LALVGVTDPAAVEQGSESLVLGFEVVYDFLLEDVGAFVVSDFIVAERVFGVVLVINP
jgi:hypothetical protein